MKSRRGLRIPGSWQEGGDRLLLKRNVDLVALSILGEGLCYSVIKDGRW